MTWSELCGTAHAARFGDRTLLRMPILGGRKRRDVQGRIKIDSSSVQFPIHAGSVHTAALLNLDGRM